MTAPDDDPDTGETDYASLFHRTPQNFTGQDAQRIRDLFAAADQPGDTLPEQADQP